MHNNLWLRMEVKEQLTFVSSEFTRVFIFMFLQICLLHFFRSPFFFFAIAIAIFKKINCFKNTQTSVVRRIGDPEAGSSFWRVYATGRRFCQHRALLEVRVWHKVSIMSKNQRIALIFGGFVTAVAAAFYPIFYYPLTHKSEYSKCRVHLSLFAVSFYNVKYFI